MMRTFAALSLVAFIAAGDRTLITKKGEIYKGKVSQSGNTYLVDSLAGPRQFPAAEVACVFDDPHEIVLQADDRYRVAKRIYEESEKLPDTDRLKNEKILAAIEMAQGAATLCNLVESHCRDEDKAAIGKSMPVIMQFIRLCRQAATSDIAGAPPVAKLKTVALVETRFAFQPPPPVEHKWVHKEELGPGLAACAQDLLNPDAARRLEASKRLSHPPAVAHLTLLLKLFESEHDPEIVKILADGLGWQDPAVVLKSLGWAKRESDPSKRSIAFSVARASGDRAGFDFLLDWFTETAPAKHEDRASFGSAFRQYHAWSGPQLRELLTRQRNPRLQMEILRQLAAVGDKASAPILVKAMTSYPRDAVVSLLKLGKPALPAIIEGSRSEQPEMRRLCIWLCRKITGVNTSFNTVTFETWWAANRKQVADDEKAWWEEQAKHNHAVPPAFFAPYDLPIEAIVN